jgi:anaerobic selenocysteine-containing dehydrogenase
MGFTRKYDYQKKFGTCSKDCYGSCVFESKWDDISNNNKFLEAKPLEDHPFTKGFFCPKLNEREKLIYHPERLKQPLLHVGPKGRNNFKPITLKQSVEIITEKLCSIRKKFGSKSIIVAFNAGNYGLLSRYAPLRFFGKLGSTITRGGICNEGGCAGLTKVFGTYSLTNPFQLVNRETKLIVNWGSDLSNRNIHAYNLIKKAKTQGVKLIVINSRRTKMFEEADYSFEIYPGTDHLIAQILIKSLILNDLYDVEFLKKKVNGYESLIERGYEINEKNLINQLGIDARSINKFIELLNEHKGHTIFNVGFSVQKDFYGGRIIQTIALIQILLGNFGKNGTGLIYSQSDFNKSFQEPLLNYITQIKPTTSIPSIELIELGVKLLSSKYKMLFVYNFNPASSLPNQKIVRKSLSRRDLFIVVQELFLNETTKYADLVIPSKFDLESYDLIAPYYIPGLSINQPGPCPYSECLTNYELFQLLSIEMGWKNYDIFEESEQKIVQNCLNLIDSKIRKEIKKKGYYLLFKENDVAFANLNFPTYSGKIELSGFRFNFGKNQLQKRLNREKDEFFLITPSHKYFIHSQFGQIHSKYVNDFNKVFLNKSDITRLNLIQGEKVIVSNEYGKIKYFVEESNLVRSGVALIFSGCPSPLNGDINVNFLISDRPEELGFSGAFNSSIVKINRVNSKVS